MGLGWVVMENVTSLALMGADLNSVMLVSVYEDFCVLWVSMLAAGDEEHLLAGGMMIMGEELN